MNVAEKDAVVSEMLSDELSRCEEALVSISRALSNLPKGSLGPRRKVYKGKEYKYHYLKFRLGKKVVSKHVSENELEALREKLSHRKKYELEAKVYRKRIAYLKRIMKAKEKPLGNQDNK